MSQQRPILIIDDDEDDVFFAKRLLAGCEMACSFLTCSDGAEAVLLLEKLLRADECGLPSMIFLDVKMPQLNGFETLKWIRSQDRLAGVSVIMLSGSEQPRDMEAARRLGADAYLVKYPSHEVLVHAMREAREASVSRVASLARHAVADV